MRIGIIGSGNVGGTLGTRLAQAGHEVVFSSRNPQSKEMADLVERAGKTARAGSVADAAKADVLLVATPWPATEQAVKSAGDLSGKVVIDATNPLLPDLSGLTLGTTTSAAEQVAHWAAGAKVVKAFNTVGSNIMENPRAAGDTPVMFYAGDDAGAKDIVKGLATKLGFDAVDAGPLRQARLLEPFALLWISLAYQGGFGRGIAFRFLRQPA